MTDERYKELMEQVGMPNSHSLLGALRQVANEVAQEVHREYKKQIFAALDAPTMGDMENILYSMIYKTRKKGEKEGLDLVPFFKAQEGACKK